MSTQSRIAKEAIERLIFKSTKPVVVALTGGWGEGKTYFWKNVVVPAHTSIPMAFVSVFGAESLPAIRESVVLATYSKDEKSKWVRNIRTVITNAVGAGASFLGVSSTLATEILHEHRITRGLVICIDDVERLSADVGFARFLGYVSELRDRYGAKVVLIYNREPIEANDENSFRTYQEKVIDRTIPFSLDLQDIVNLAFKDVEFAGFNVVSEVQARAELLGLRNIRILGKARGYFDEILQIVGPTASPDFLRAALSALILFVYAKYSNQKPQALSLTMITHYSSIADRMRRNRQSSSEESPQADPAGDLLEKYGHLHTDDLDRLLLKLVESDTVDADRLRVLSAEHQEESVKSELNAKLRAVWERFYHGTFRNNAEELCDALQSTVEPYLEYISPTELDLALEILEENRRTDAARRLFDRFVQIRGEVFEALDAESMPHGSYGYEPLRAYIDALKARVKNDTRPIKEVLDTALNEEFVAERDCKRIADFSSGDIAEYFLSQDVPKITSKMKRLITTGDERVRHLALAAARIIAEKSPLNQRRLEGMGLVPAKSA